MKFQKSYLFIMLVLCAGLMTACSSDNETIVVPKTLEQYKQEFGAYVAAQLDVVNSCVVGYNKGDFRSSTNYDTYTAAYRAVLEAAQSVLEDPEVTIADIVDANQYLASPGKNFTNSLFISDRRPLHEVILECDSINSAIADGTEPGQVDPAARFPFTEAIAAAKVVRSASATVERQVAEGVEKLTAARLAFESAIVK